MTAQITHRAFVVVLSLVLLAGCSVPLVGTLTPEQAARQSLSAPGGDPSSFRLASTRTLPSGKVVVLYYATHTLPSGNLIDTFNYTVLERASVGWQSVAGGGGDSGKGRPAAELVKYGTGGGSLGMITERFAMVDGEALAPEVVAVEATFDTGQVVRDLVVDGVFAVVLEGANDACEVRILGANDVVLRTDDVRPPLDSPVPTRCPRP